MGEINNYTPELDKIKATWSSGERWIEYNNSLLLKLCTGGGNGIPSKKGHDILDAIVKACNTNATLYEQNFKMLEALKEFVNPSTGEVYLDFHGIISKRLRKRIEQTIKECEL